MDRKFGVINSFNSRGFGVIRVGPQSSLERYYLHVSKIRSGTATPTTGMEVFFDVSDEPVLEGRLPQALRADVIVPDEPSISDINAVPDAANPSSPVEDGQQ